MRAVLRAVLVALLYFATARLGYASAIPRGMVTLWPPSGVMLGLLLLSKRRDWPAIVLGGLAGSLLSDHLQGYSLPLAVAAALANGAEWVLAAWVVTWRLGQPVALSSLRSVVEFTVGATVLCNALTACVGAVVLHRGFQLPLESAWLIWWLGDGLGMLIVTPVFLAWARIADFARKLRPRAILEAAVLVVALGLISQIAFGPVHAWPVHPAPYATFPLLFWAALRFGPAGASTGSLLIAAVAMGNAAFGVGPFADAASSNLNVAMQLYAFLAVVSLSSLIPAAVLEERKVAGQRLRESEERYRTVVDAATDAIVTIDEHSRIQFANPATERVFGYPAAELVGRDLTMLMPAELREPHKSSMAPYLETGQKQIEWRSVSLTGLHKDGRHIPLEVSFGELVEEGRHVFTGVLRDISEKLAAEQALRAAEDRMRFAMETARVGVWDADLTTGVTHWSETLEALHGMPAGSYAGTMGAFVEHIHSADRQSVQAEIDKAIRRHTDSNIVYRTVWPDASVHWITGVGRTFYDAAGIPVRSVGIGMDITERRALEEQYRQAQKMEAIGQLAGGVAHDFNNLLTAIQGYGSLLSKALGPESPHQPDLSEILRAADRAASLTRQLLAFSRKQVLAPRLLNLSESLKAMEPMLQRLIGEHIDVVTRTPSDVGTVRADPGQIEQVVLNLAINARDAMPDGGMLMLEVMNIDLDESDGRRHIDVTPGPYVMLAVSDSGVGMDAATAAHIFEPFFTTKPQGKGTGLGLSTVYGIVKQSGGTVLVNSEPGRGTTFKVLLPRVDPRHELVASEEPADIGPASEFILVVEDEDSLRKLVLRTLADRGYRVRAATSPMEALDIAARHAGRIDLLLTDVVLPEMGGRSLAEQLIPRHPCMRVLYMSGYTDDLLVHGGVLERETQFIQKPFTGDALLRTVRDTLDRTKAAPSLLP